MLPWEKLGEDILRSPSDIGTFNDLATRASCTCLRDAELPVGGGVWIDDADLTVSAEALFTIAFEDSTVASTSHALSVSRRTCVRGSFSVDLACADVLLEGKAFWSKDDSWRLESLAFKLSLMGDPLSTVESGL